MTRNVFAAMLAAVISTAAMGQPQRTAVPAFFPVNQQTDPSKGYDWSRIVNAGAAVLAVVPEEGFPGLTGDCSSLPSDCHAPGVAGLCQAKCQFAANHRAGQLVFGYVITDSGKRDYNPANCSRPDHACALYGGDLLAPVNGGFQGKTFVKQWFDTYCPNSANCYIDGIFFDVGPSLDSSPGARSETEQIADYQALYQAVTTWPGATGPCGTPPHLRPCVMVNASQFPNPWIMSYADYLVVWERALHGADMSPPDSQDYFTNFIPNPTWWTTAAQVAEHTVYSATQNDITNIVNTSRNRGAPLVYIHDQPHAHYGTLACYFEQEVAALQNQPPVSGKTWCSAPAAACYDLNSDSSHCGSCNATPCNGGWTCQNGQCVPPSGAPVQPWGLIIRNINMSSTQMGLGWSWGANDNTAAYRVYRNDSLIATLTESATQSPPTSYVDNGVSYPNSYTYYLVGVNASGVAGPQSAAVTGTPNAPGVCNASTCYGCCNAQGQCDPSGADTSCPGAGTQGSACVDCTANGQLCTWNYWNSGCQ